MVQTLRAAAVPTQKPRISFIADDELLPKLKAWAEEEYRTVSNLVEAIVKDAVDRKEGRQAEVAQALAIIKRIETANAPEPEELRAAIAAIEKGLSD